MSAFWHAQILKNLGQIVKNKQKFDTYKKNCYYVDMKCLSTQL